jgi:hypothetical protein
VAPNQGKLLQRFDRSDLQPPAHRQASESISVPGAVVLGPTRLAAPSRSNRSTHRPPRQSRLRRAWHGRGMKWP